ncbi:MAG: hypothetical protein LIP02_07525 [Bacteroidales bacterium]|nr:hypothetical protein [Bacteroidales bacterium]
MRILYSVCSLALAATMGFSASAADAITGYFRVQSALGTSDGTGYVEVKSPFRTAPDNTKAEALTKPGTVMRLRAFPVVRKSQTIDYMVCNLSSQGIEVFGTPKSDYMDAIEEIFTDINLNNYRMAAYDLQRVGRDLGYMATGRVIVQALFEVVATRLDDEIAKLTDEQKASLGTASMTETLAEFAQRFNKEVSANIDLFAYLEPVSGQQYRLYFNWIDCTSVSKFYLANEQNKKSFEIGFECMRHYMSTKSGLSSGETIDASEYALWKSWGYDLDVNYHDCYNSEKNRYDLTYEKIFADHELLYNWLKMYVERFLDPEKAPDAEILGINFVDFATEMQKHEIMQGFLKYIPSIQEGQKLYLTSGRFTDGVNEFSTVGTVSDNSQMFGLLGETQAKAAGNAAIWNLIPMDTEDNYLSIPAVAHRTNKPNEEDGHLIAWYVDFPFEMLTPDNAKLMPMSSSYSLQSKVLQNLGITAKYITVNNEVSKVDRQTPVLVDMKTTTLADNIVKIIWADQDNDYTPTDTGSDGFIIGGDDDEIDIQRDVDVSTTSTAVVYGVLLDTAVDKDILYHEWLIEYDPTSQMVYDLGTRENKIEGGRTDGAVVYMNTPWFFTTSTIPANHTILVADNTDVPTNPERMISLNEAADEYDPLTGVSTIGVDSTEGTQAIYDLQGRRVNTVVPGNIYIMGGQKILVTSVK